MTRRVLHVSRVGFVGGAERVTLTLLAGLPQYGYAPVLACPGDGELARAARAEGATVVPCGFSRMRISANPLVVSWYPFALVGGATAVLSYCRAHDIELVHAHHPVGALYSLLTIKLLRLPLVLHLHDGLPLRPLYALALRAVAKHSDRIICVPTAARQLVDEAGIRKGVEIVHNGVASSFLSDRYVAPSKEVEGDGPHIGVFGTIEPRKGQDVFLTAAAVLADEYPKAQFWIVGPFALRDKTTYLHRLKQLAEVPSLTGRVHFAGYREDVAAWMQAMDVITLPSVSHETLGMVLIEAMALGRPVVASRLGGIREVVKDGETGRLVAPGDPTDLASGIAEVLRNRGHEFGVRAAADIRRRFSPEQFCGRIAQIYQETLSAQ